MQYPDVRTADTAKQALEGHAMYDGGHNVVSFCCCFTSVVQSSLCLEGHTMYNPLGHTMLSWWVACWH